MATVIFALGYRRWIQLINHKAEKGITYANRETFQWMREKQKWKNKTMYLNILNETVADTITASRVVQQSLCWRAGILQCCSHSSALTLEHWPQGCALCPPSVDTNTATGTQKVPAVGQAWEVQLMPSTCHMPVRWRNSRGSQKYLSLELISLIDV